jgi:hypothetical protein
MPTLDNMSTVCYGCRQLIDDRYYLMAVDRSWHLSCLKCFDCGMSLEQERTCFARFGQIFCKDDYIKYVLEEEKTTKEKDFILEDIVLVFVHDVIQ